MTITNPRTPAAADVESIELPGGGIDTSKMPGHWLLARLGKRVLRPGGLEITGKMLDGLKITSTDRVVEFAPGMGLTTRRVLAANPAEYTAVEADPQAAERVKAIIGETHRCQLGTAQNSGLEDGCATVVFGEAYLTMQSDEHKRQIAAEAFRLLAPGGRYGLHEIAILPDNASEELQNSVRGDLTRSIHVGARPVTTAAWREILTSVGFEVEMTATAPMALLRPRRVLADEGWGRSAKFLFNVLRQPGARKRVMEMRSIFQRHKDNMSALTLVARKP